MNQADVAVRDDVGRRAALADDPVDARRSAGAAGATARPSVNSRMSASSAFWPRHGSDEACAWRPVKTTSTSSEASGWLSTWLRSHGWYSRAASRPSNSPSSIMICLPLPRSSAGVPRNTISPGQLVGDGGQGDGRPDARTRPSCCGRSRGRGRAGRRTRRGCRCAGRRRRGRPGAYGPDRRREAAGRMLDRRSRGARSASAIQVAAWCSSKAGSGFGVDPVRQVEDLVAGRLDGGGQPGLGVGVRLGRGGRDAGRARILRDGRRHGRSGAASARTGRSRDGRRRPAAAAGSPPVSARRTGSPPRRPRARG